MFALNALSIERDNIAPEMDENVEDEEIGDGDFDTETGVPFKVTIEKNGHKVIVDCVAASMIEIQNVQYCPSGKDVVTDNLYGGPIFEDLDESLQDSFAKYLESLGINDDMIYFINAYADRKEQREYENWLKAIQAFVA